MARLEEAAQRVTATDVRAAFSRGVSPVGAALLLRARDEGLGWEPVTQAVAAGLADHYGTVENNLVIPRSRQSSVLVLLLSGVAMYAILRPVLGLGHELVVAALAWILQVVVGTGVWEPVIRLLGLDPIYAGAAIRAIGGVQVTGFAIANPVGSGLHSLLPSIFLEPDRVVDGAGISMVASPGAPALGRGVASFGADVVWLAVGIWLFWGWRRVHWRLALLGLLIQAQIAVNHLFEADLSLADLDASGLPFAIALAVPSGGWVTTALAGLQNDVRDTIVGGSLAAFGYASGVVLLMVVVGLGRLLRITGRTKRRVAPSSPPTRWGVVLLSIALAVGTAWSPIGALALGTPNWQAAGATGPLSVAPRRTASRRHTLRLAGATRVAIAPRPAGGWTYLVDGTAETIRGVGYNPQYAAFAPADRAALYERDFGDMQRLGVNTIEGWFEGQFDSVTLDHAQHNGIGVLMPFELNQDLDYTDPAVRAGILDRISAYVEQYKNHPAVRMWAPGNENLHRILYQRWVSQMNVQGARARAAAFAAFLPVLVDRIHELDPNHPVVYRDAEDVYLGWIASAFAQAGGDRPWLVYGANVYSARRLQEVISTWPAQWPGRPLLISEFAPGGVGPAERAFGFQQQWSVIRSRPDVVVGGLAYTWAINGPEDLDRVFGLVDIQGVPTDGALAALSDAYLAEAGTVADSATGY